MPRASQALVTSIATERAHLKSLEASLMAAGDKELAKAVKRARRELDLPVVTGAENTMGVNHGGLRK